MDITWITKDYGREGELARLNIVRNDPKKQAWVRKSADKNHAKIVRQLKDKKLMGMRVRLIKAARAGDALEQAKIQQQMRDYEGAEKETGLYEQS
jgi:hypothetical protein